MKLPAGTTIISGHSGQSRKLVPGFIGGIVCAQAATRSPSATGMTAANLRMGSSRTAPAGRAGQAIRD
jgi:hypothetical protein